MSSLNKVFPSALPEEPADLFTTNKEILTLEDKGNVFLKRSIPIHIAVITILVISALAGITVICLGCYAQSILQIAIGIVLTILALFSLQAFVDFIRLVRQLPQQLHETVQFIREKIRPESSLRLVSNAQKQATEETLRLHQELSKLSQEETALQAALYKARSQLTRKTGRN
ncbi:cell division protein ZapA [Candidatus Chlamydia corallus]|uniref:cell division protein ZapA n=1 Tax=Candidatus Chlamydia corallus TaxID=2038470 RepID=UPI000C2FEB50|nr:cell division protein ZapA [Candidatus Chlamydia corallus]